ncbi:MAG: hypothetical protein QG602_2278 [Verrucomicrobiota bacterium]|nr:hypothetical protein [Verrucomicrobiota bacterium]
MKMTTRPLKPLERYAESARDHAPKGYSLGALEALISDCQGQPDWRTRADVSHAYYDMGKQLTPERERFIRVEMGIEPRQTNLIHGVINGVLGQEAKARSDIRIEADDEDFQDVADVMSKAMKEAQREANVDMAVSNGYAGQVKGGLGWVEVSRSMDPLDYTYRVADIHRNQIWWDMRAERLDLSDARWIVRKRWQDLDEAIALMPQHKRILENAINGWDLVNLPEDEDSVMYRSYNAAYNRERRTTIRRDEWCDTGRRRIKFYEVWYRVPAETVVLHVGPTKRIAYDETNPLHVQAVSRGRVKISKVGTRQIRMALFAGPHRLLDAGTARRHFPYVPFFAFRDDQDRSPYGLIEGMISPQDEYNERRQMVNWMVQARQLVLDADALDEKTNNLHDIRRTFRRPDFVAVLNPNRQNKGAGFKMGNDLSLQREQVEVMQDAKNLIQEIPRIYSTQLGNAPTGVTSGVAINSLTEQGVVAMGELNDNYRFSRKMVFEQLLDLIIEDHLEEDLKVSMGMGDSRRVVVLNSWDPQTGAPLNRVKDAPVKVGLSDVPSSPAFRMQEQQQIAQMLAALGTNPAAMNILAPVYIEGSGIENRKAIADNLRRATGVPVEGDRQAQQAAQKAQQAAMQQQQQVQQAAIEADMAEKASKIRLNDASATLKYAQAHDTGQSMAMGLQQLERDMTAPPEDPEQEQINAALAEAAQ